MHVVTVIDNSGSFKGKFHDEKFIKYAYPNQSLASSKKRI